MTDPIDIAHRRQRLLTAVLTLEPGEREELLEEVEAALARIDEPARQSIVTHAEEPRPA